MSALGIRCLAVAVCVAFGFAALEAAAGPAEIAQIKPRQDKLRDMGGALKAINDDIKKGRIDWDNTVIPNAQTIKDRSGYLLNWFPKGNAGRGRQIERDRAQEGRGRVKGAGRDAGKGLQGLP